MSQAKHCDCVQAVKCRKDERNTTSKKHISVSQPPYLLHASVVDSLSPDYVAYYNKYLLAVQPVHLQPVAVSRAGGRPNGVIIPGASDNVPVGRTHDFFIDRLQSEGPPLRIRCFIPRGQPPTSGDGWPVMVYYHGGGWVLGDIDSENQVCTNMCARANCVVITTDYRLAPEYPYPAALEDCWETLLWIVTKGSMTLDLDVTKLAIGGASAGANLAAAMTQKALLLRQAGNLVYNINFQLQLLVVPVTDNTATVENNPTYRALEHTAALPAAKILWYRNHYLPDPATWANIDASPLLLPAEKFSGLPPAVILIGGMDLLRHEAEEYARKLSDAGVPTSVEIFPGMPHPFLAMDAVLAEGRRAITKLCESLSTAFA